MVTHHSEKSNIDAKCISFLQNKSHLKLEKGNALFCYLKAHIPHSHANTHKA